MNVGAFVIGLNQTSFFFPYFYASCGREIISSKRFDFRVLMKQEVVTGGHHET